MTTNNTEHRLAARKICEKLGVQEVGLLIEANDYSKFNRRVKDQGFVKEWYNEQIEKLTQDNYTKQSITIAREANQIAKKSKNWSIVGIVIALLSLLVAILSFFL